MTASVEAKIMPPPMPWAARAAISSSIDCAAPETIEAVTKTTTATRNSGLRP